MEHEGDFNNNHIWSPWNNPEKPRKEPGGNGNERKNWTVQTAEIRYNTEKSPGKPRRLVDQFYGVLIHKLNLNWAAKILS